MKMCKYLYIVSRLFAIFALRIINGRMERLEIMSRSGDGSLIYCFSLNNPVTDARYSGQLPESSSLIA